MQTIEYMATLHSSSYLWVIGCCQRMPYAQNFHQFIILLVHELPSLVTGQHLWQPHRLEDLEVQVCKQATKIAFCLMISINGIAQTMLLQLRCYIFPTFAHPLPSPLSLLSFPFSFISPYRSRMRSPCRWTTLPTTLRKASQSHLLWRTLFL